MIGTSRHSNSNLFQPVLNTSRPSHAMMLLPSFGALSIVLHSGWSFGSGEPHLGQFSFITSPSSSSRSVVSGLGFELLMATARDDAFTVAPFTHLVASLVHAITAAGRALVSCLVTMFAEKHVIAMRRAVTESWVINPMVSAVSAFAASSAHSLARFHVLAPVSGWLQSE